MSSAALFPISPHGRRINSRMARILVDALPSAVDTVVVLAADQLERYNAAIAKIQVKGSQEHDMGPDDSLQDLGSIRDAVCRTRACEVVYASEVEDRSFFDIYRRIVIAYNSVPRLRKDVVSTALAHVARKGWSRKSSVVDLSCLYVLEEIALNIRMRVSHGIPREYYYGDIALPLVGLYDGRYGLSPWEIAGFPQSDEKFEFFRWSEDLNDERWVPA